MQKLGMSMFAAVLMMAAMGCDDGVIDKTGQAVRCGEICQAVDKCTGEDNSTACRKECVGDSDNDEVEEEVEECAQCVERTDSCRENVINCATECAGVVVLSAT